MSEYREFHFDENVYRRNRRRRYWRNVFFGFLLIILLQIALSVYNRLLGGFSFIMDRSFCSTCISWVFPLLLFSIFEFFRKDPTPKQTVRISSSSVQIEQNQEIFDIDRATILEIQELADKLVLEGKKEKYQLSKDFANFEDLVTALAQNQPVKNLITRRRIFIGVGIVVSLSIAAGMFHLMFLGIFWPAITYYLLVVTLFFYSVIISWNKLPFQNSDVFITKRSQISFLAFASFAFLIIPFLIPYLLNLLHQF